MEKVAKKAIFLPPQKGTVENASQRQISKTLQIAKVSALCAKRGTYERRSNSIHYSWPTLSAAAAEAEQTTLAYCKGPIYSVEFFKT